VRKVASAPANQPGEPAEHPIEMLTLVTLDLCHGADGALRRDLTFERAVEIHAALIAQGIRLGQPVRCVRLADGGWGATLRIGLSMPQVSMLAALDDDSRGNWLARRMEQVRDALAAQLSS
jgi:hypothetical protein